MKTPLLILLALLAASCAPAPPPRDEAARATRAAFAEQSRKSLAFHESDLLARLEVNPFNGFCFLLDQALAPGFSGPGPAPDPAGGALAAFEFPAAADIFMTPSGDPGRSEEGLILAPGRTSYLVNRGGLDINRDELSEIEIRLRLEGHAFFRIGLTAHDLADWREDRMALVNVPAVGGEEFRVYRILLPHLFEQASFKRNLPAGGMVKKLFLAGDGVSEENIEVASIRFLAPGAGYRRSPYGTGFLTAGEVGRGGFWMPGAGKLSWEIGLPAQSVFFRAGVGLFRKSLKGVEYDVRVAAAGEETTLAGGVLADHSAWTDLGPIDLGRWSGQTVVLSIETRGEETNTVFWGDPAIREMPRERFNVVIILEDALRAGHLGCYGYTLTETPGTDRLAEEGILFQTAVSQATMTRPSCPSLLTSLYPSATGVRRFQDSLDDRFLTLAEVMRSQGFLTAAFVQNPAGGAAAGLQQGFGEFHGRKSAGYLTKHLLPERMKEWLGKNGRHNFFIYLHLQKPHGPYDPLAPFDAAFRRFTGPGTPVTPHHALDPARIEQPTREGRILAYDGEISANDYHLGLFLDLLAEEDLRENTLVAVISDHGEFLGEDGRWGHSPPGLLQVIHVPLILSCRRLWKEGKRIAAPVQLLDLMPTVLDLAGVPPERLPLQGRSLLPLIEDPASAEMNSRPVFSEEVSNLRREKEKRGLGSVIWGGKHFLFSNALGKDGDWSRQSRVFLLTGGAEEETEADAEEIAEAYRLLIDLQDAGEAVNRNISRPGEKVQQHDPEAVKQLRALGYLQ